MSWTAFAIGFVIGFFVVLVIAYLCGEDRGDMKDGDDLW